MTEEISARQLEILKSIIQEYILTGQEVSSNQLIKRYDYELSSATIRNEMAALMDKGYLEKSHFSSGRVPTDLAFRLYVKEMVQNGEKNEIDELEIRNEIFRERFDEASMIDYILSVLSENITGASFIIKDDQMRYHGVSRLMRYDELRDVLTIERLMDLLEDKILLKNILSRYNTADVGLIIGRELGIDDLEDCSLAYTTVGLIGDDAFLGVIGSRRVDYAKMLKMIKSIRDAVDRSLQGWNNNQ